MHRIFIRQADIVGQDIIIKDADELHHLRDVLRVKQGEKISAADERGNEYICAARLEKASLVLGIKQRKLLPKDNAQLNLTIACAIPQNVKMDGIVDKLTQLGADRIIPLETKRTIVKLDAKKAAARLERWKKIALSASQQSQRRMIPEIKEVIDLAGALKLCADCDLKLIPHLEGKRIALKEVLSGRTPKKIAVFIGPEGDFTEEEVELANKAGCVSVSLGELVLRVDTAAIAVASMISLTRSYPQP